MAHLMGWLVCTSCMGNVQTEIDTTTVRQLNLQRYMGKWYEIARYNHWFEKGMTHVIAEYSMQPDGRFG